MLFSNWVSQTETAGDSVLLVSFIECRNFFLHEMENAYVDFPWVQADEMSLCRVHYLIFVLSSKEE